MSDRTQVNLTVSMLAKGSMAQLREVVDHADREQARQMHAELIRLANKLGRKFGFRGAGSREKESVRV